MRKSAKRGFTLVELMIVVTVMLILMSIAIPIYQSSITHAKETVLRQDLATMRKNIEAYTGDKRKAPESLQDLVTAGYMRALPKDPFTDSSDTWTTTTMDATDMTSGDTADTGGGGGADQPMQLNGITNVHSGSTLTASDGTPYSEW